MLLTRRYTRKRSAIHAICSRPHGLYACTLSGSNTYSGTTTISTLLAGATNAFSTISATTINTGGILDLGTFA
jgi:hypothetical protein